MTCSPGEFQAIYECLLKNVWIEVQEIDFDITQQRSKTFRKHMAVEEKGHVRFT